MTTFEYDDEGRIARSVTVREPEWRPSDVSLLIASKHLELRDSTGHLLVESTDLAANPANPDGQWFYRAGVRMQDGTRGPVTNWAEKARADAQKAWREKYPNADMSGLHWPVERVERRRRTSQ